MSYQWVINAHSKSHDFATAAASSYDFFPKTFGISILSDTDGIVNAKQFSNELLCTSGIWLRYILSANNLNHVVTDSSHNIDLWMRTRFCAKISTSAQQYRRHNSSRFLPSASTVNELTLRVLFPAASKCCVCAWWTVWTFWSVRGL